MFEIGIMKEEDCVASNLDNYTKCPCGQWRITPCGLGVKCKAFYQVLVPIDYDIDVKPKSDRSRLSMSSIVVIDG